MAEPTIAQAVQRANDEQFVLHTPDVGGLTGALISAVAVLAFVFSKLRKMGKIDTAEGDFYAKISEENTRLVARIKSLEETKDACQNDLSNLRAEVGALRAQLGQINVLEMENVHLRERLNEKDEQIAAKNKQIEDMISALMAKDNYILELTNRVHALELRLSADEKKFCTDCPRMSGAIGQ